ncbi:gamma-glutamylcyclotransferase isoform X1 [Bemisia tabaci]|nr:PREDICTED: gamma-glutamylcyclotransferase-like isoform X3 [Bemisia tabaci]
MSGTFLYFAYGSNLLTKRIHINNPTAVRKGIAKLENYRLDFNYYSHRWKGCAATVVPDEGKHVYGALWEIGNENMAALDKQEGVDTHVYEVIKVSVQTPEGTSVESRSYQLCDLPPPVPEGEKFPDERRPSKIYLRTIIDGAIESKLPAEYITYLRSFPDNGYEGEINLHDSNSTSSG